jgi:hypothetical protein
MDIEIVKLKIRRGTDSQRRAVILEQGELGYTTDTKRVWVGDGFTSGGQIVGNIIHAPLTIGSRILLTDAVLGDIVYDNNLLYQLSGNDYSQVVDWAFIGTKIDPTYFEYNVNNKLTLLGNSISASNLDSSVVYADGALSVNSSGLSANVDNTTIGITTSNTLSVIQVGVDQINSSAFGNGISGGSGDTIGVDATANFKFISGQLELSAVPASALTNTIDTDDFTVGASKLALTPKYASGSATLATISTDANGFVSSLDTAIYNALTANDSTTTTFNGYGNVDYINNTTVPSTIIECISANYDRSASTTIPLSSAGFITIDGVQPSDSEEPIDRFAIPIFRY